MPLSEFFCPFWCFLHPFNASFSVTLAVYLNMGEKSGTILKNWCYIIVLSLIYLLHARNYSIIISVIVYVQHKQGCILKIKYIFRVIK